MSYTTKWVGAKYYSGSGSRKPINLMIPHISECPNIGILDNTFNGSRQASTHYGVAAGVVHQYVRDNNVAWGAGNWPVNQRSLQFELVGTTANPPTKAVLDTAAELMADKARELGWTKLYLGNNVGLHKWYAATACPGPMDYNYLVAKANELLGAGGTPSRDPEVPWHWDEQLGDLRFWGPKYTREFQGQLGTTKDGIISRQPKSNKKYCLNCDASSWKFGATVSSTGYQGSMAMKQWQRKLKGLGLYDGAIDGFCGKKTWVATQKFCEKNGQSVGIYGCNGYSGPDTNVAFGKVLKAGKVKQ